MPAFSGLYDEVHGEAYAMIGAPVPPISGILRVLMQKRGLFGVVREYGRNAPDTIKVVDADRNDLAVRGGWDYATRTNDAGNQVTITNLGGGVVPLEDRAMPVDATAAHALLMTDTHLNREYAADAADNGATAVALPEAYAVP